MRQPGPQEPAFSPDELLTIGRMFSEGSDTLDIARKLRVHESVVANSLGMARSYERQQRLLADVFIEVPL
jgi:hypothetical protein